MKQLYKKISLIITLVLMVGGPLLPIQAYGANSDDKNSYINDTLFYDPSNGSSTCSVDSSTTTLSGTDNEQKAFNYFTEKGLTTMQVAGIIGNLMIESTIDPTINQANGGIGRGIAQWSVDGRWVQENQFAAEKNADPLSLSLQLDFMWKEMTDGYGNSLTDLKATTTTDDATTVFEADYEGDGTYALDARKRAANSAYELYGGNGATSVTTPGSTTSSCDYTPVSCTATTPVQGSGQTTGLSAVRQNVVCDTQNELALWSAGKLKPGTDFYKYSDGVSELWCADFTSWIYKQAGYQLDGDSSVEDNGWRVPGVSGIEAIGRLNQKFHYHAAGSGYVPKPGDMALHDYQGHHDAHVNIVVAVNGTKLTLTGGDQGGDENAAVYQVTSYVNTYNTTGYTSDSISSYVSPD